MSFHISYILFVAVAALRSVKLRAKSYDRVQASRYLLKLHKLQYTNINLQFFQHFEHYFRKSTS